MPYGITWTSLTRPGTRAANNAAADLTSIPDALKERFEDVLIVSATADPWVLKDGVLGKVTGKKLIIPHTAFRERTGGVPAQLADQALTSVGDTGTLYAGIDLPVGVTITLIEFLVTRLSGSVLWTFYKTAFGVSVASTVIASGAQATGGTQIISSAALTEVTDGSIYYLSLDSNLSGSITPVFLTYGARVIYDTPSSQVTR